VSGAQHFGGELLPPLNQQFGQLEVNDARRLKELERDNGELKKMLAEAVCKKFLSLDIDGSWR
jgi:hypothetical protein